jgi:uncharacterized protein YjbI with pentapeptide repeats
MREAEQRKLRQNAGGSSGGEDRSMADESKKIVPASEILERIRNGEPVEYDNDNVVVEGDLDLSMVDLPTQQVERTKYEIEVLELSETAKVVASAIRITNCKINGSVIFSNCILQKRVDFKGTQFTGSASFTGTEFEGDTIFGSVQFEGPADFNATKFAEGYFSSDFSGAQFYGCDSYFIGAHFGGNARFNDAEFLGETLFMDAQFEGPADFSGAEFEGNAYFWGAQFTGEVLTFRNAKFAIPEFQKEDACRRAKNVLQRAGDREEEGYHFYREMEAKRKQKPWYYRYPEYVLIQLIFGYGVHPGRLWLWWFFFVGIFAFIYWLEAGIEGAKDPIDYIWFSIATAATPGYALYRPEAGFKLVAGIEALMGTFMWAAFITTFARKYMR